MSITTLRTRDDDISTRLFWTAEYFRGAAMLGGLMLGLSLVAMAVTARAEAGAMILAHPFKFTGFLLLSIVTYAGWYLTGEALHARRRVGGWFALATMAPPIIKAIAVHAPPGLGLVVAVLGTLAILSSWRELD